MRLHNITPSSATTMARLARPHLQRSRHQISAWQSTLAETSAPRPSSRWLSELQDCLRSIRSRSNLSTADLKEVQAIQSHLGHDWLALLAGSEGFLTSPPWRGLNKHQVVWGDMYGHVNNVVYNKFAESSRVNWICNLPLAQTIEEKAQWTELMTPRSVGLILKSIRTEYKFPLTYPDEVTVIHKLLDNSVRDSGSIFFEVIILSEKHKRIAARCFEHVVVYDYRRATKSPLHGRMADRLQEVLQLQKSNRVEAQATIASLQRRAEDLERAVKR